MVPDQHTIVLKCDWQIIFVLDRYLDEVLPGWLETALGRRQVDLLASADSTPEAALDWGRLRGVGAAGGLTPV